MIETNNGNKFAFDAIKIGWLPRSRSGSGLTAR